MGQLHEKELLEVVADLCHFIMHEVINPRGTFYSKDHKLATDPKYIDLRKWENKKHRASSSSVGKQEKNMDLRFNFNDVLYTNYNYAL